MKLRPGESAGRVGFTSAADPLFVVAGKKVAAGSNTGRQ